MENIEKREMSHSNDLADLDESLRSLSSSERELVLMKFFEGRTYPAIAAKTGRSESAEKMRLKRALEKMSNWFGKKGVTLSVSGLTAVLSTEMSKGAPAGLMAGVAEASVTGMRSGKMVSGVALLMTAGFAVPVLSSWGEVRKLEERLEVLSVSDATKSSRNERGVKPTRGVDSMIRLADEEMTLDEIVTRSIRAGAFQNRLDDEVLKRQMTRLDLGELVEVATRLHSRYGKMGIHSLGENLVLKELRTRLKVMTPAERLDFLIPLRISIAPALREFSDWVEKAPAGEVGSWLRENDEYLEMHMWGFALQRDLKGRMWRKYLSILSKEKIDDAVHELRLSPLSSSQKAKWLNDLANAMGSPGIEKDYELMTREYRLGEGSLQYAWGKIIMRHIDGDLERIGDWMTEHQIEGEDRKRLLKQVFQNLHPDLKKREFSERLDWLRRNVPSEEWGDLVDANFVWNYEKPGTSESGNERLAAGFEEVFSQVTEGLEREVLAYAAASASSYSGGPNDVGLIAKTMSFLTQIADETKRNEVIRGWLSFVKRHKPTMIPLIEVSLKKAGLQVGGRPE